MKWLDSWILEQCDRICYFHDYGDEWRFYAILKEVPDDKPSDTERMS
ncbi:hypothetical protein [Haloplanus salinus]|nr:hypothetical protein [Haloplanus salinus]